MDPWETQDREDLAEIYYDQPTQAKNRTLEEENQRLKRLLRENGISWSPISTAYIDQQLRTRSGRITRRSTAAASTLPYLPVEVLLRVLTYAVTSDYPIIDPLCKLRPENITSKEKHRGNQLAIHFLVTCKAMHTEGTRLLWSQNTFTFTRPENLRSFAQLDASFRKTIRHINLRIIVQFYDDRKRTHLLDRHYHSSLRKAVNLPIKTRINEETYARGGFRVYSWSQIVDFLQALRAPWDPKHDKKVVRPRLLPNLETMRMDLVNFGEEILPMFGHELHNMASHELGCSLNELHVTGLPVDDPGLKASSELTGLLKDEGLYLTAIPSYVQSRRGGLIPLPGGPCTHRTVRAWKPLHKNHHLHSHTDEDSEMTDSDLLDEIMDHHHSHGPSMPPAPAETGHPKSTPRRKDKTIWRRVPVSRDSDTRKWVEFCRISGLPVENIKRMVHGEEFEDMDDDDYCACCGSLHPGGGLDFFMDDDM
jgi:hypothetical protein